MKLVEGFCTRILFSPSGYLFNAPCGTPELNRFSFSNDTESKTSFGNENDHWDSSDPARYAAIPIKVRGVVKIIIAWEVSDEKDDSQ